MKVQLIISDPSAPCKQAEKIWRGVAAERDMDFSLLDLAEPEGKALADRLQLKTVPALVVDGVLVAIGVQSPDEARALVAQAPVRRRLE